MGQNGCDMIKLLIAARNEDVEHEIGFSYRKCKLLICRFWLFGIFVEKKDWANHSRKNLIIRKFVHKSCSFVVRYIK